MRYTIRIAILLGAGAAVILLAAWYLRPAPADTAFAVGLNGRAAPVEDAAGR